MYYPFLRRGMSEAEFIKTTSYLEPFFSEKHFEDYSRIYKIPCVEIKNLEEVDSFFDQEFGFTIKANVTHKKNWHIPKALSTVVVLCILVPNFPGFIYGGDIKAFWMIMSMMVIWLYPQKNFFIYTLLMGIISIPFLLLSFSVKYFLVVFIPFFVFYSLPAFFQLKTSLKILSFAIIVTGLLSILGLQLLILYFILFLEKVVE